MTDEERQKLQLIVRLRHATDEKYTWDIEEVCNRAADEIERLAAENAELRKTQLTFRTIERQPFTIKDEP